MRGVAALLFAAASGTIGGIAAVSGAHHVAAAVCLLPLLWALGEVAGGSRRRVRRAVLLVALVTGAVYGGAPLPVCVGVICVGLAAWDLAAAAELVRGMGDRRCRMWFAGRRALVLLVLSAVSIGVIAAASTRSSPLGFWGVLGLSAAALLAVACLLAVARRVLGIRSVGDAGRRG